LLEKIVSQGKRRGEKFTAPGGAILGEFWRGGENLVGFGDEIFERCEFFPL
jgi:hypothetical protein